MDYVEPSYNNIMCSATGVMLNMAPCQTTNHQNCMSNAFALFSLTL